MYISCDDSAKCTFHVMTLYNAITKCSKIAWTLYSSSFRVDIEKEKKNLFSLNLEQLSCRDSKSSCLRMCTRHCLSHNVWFILGFSLQSCFHFLCKYHKNHPNNYNYNYTSSYAPYMYNIRLIVSMHFVKTDLNRYLCVHLITLSNIYIFISDIFWEFLSVAPITYTCGCISDHVLRFGGWSMIWSRFFWLFN